jgi:hypothetical protein
MRAVGTAALAAVLAISTGTALAGATEQSAGPTGPTAPVTSTARPTLKVVVIGDSFTSGEGASSSTYKQVPAPDVTEDGIAYTSMKIDPAHQSSTAPSLQALNQIQAANPGVDLQVTFVPVSGATRDSLYQTTRPGTPFEQPPQIDAVKGADVVIVGIGGNDARFSDWVHTAVTSTEATSNQQFPQFIQQFNDGTYLNNQVKLLNDISDMASPNATIVSLGYPKALPSTVPGSMTWWSPFSWTTISQGEADMSNQLATTLNTNNQDASFIAQSAHPGQQWLYADLSTALEGHELFTNQEGLNGLTPGNLNGSYHPNDVGQQLLGATMQPYLTQAVNGQLQRLGVQGAEDVPAITPTFSNMWNLRVDLPLQQQKQDQINQQSGDKTQAPPAQNDKPEQTPQDQQTDQGAKQPDGTDQATPGQQPDGNQSDGQQPDTQKPDAGPPEGPQPDGVQPKPDASQPDTAPPDSGQSDATTPDGSGAAQPDGADATSPGPADEARPTGSDAAQPDGTAADGTAPAATDQPGAAPPDGADATAADAPASDAQTPDQSGAAAPDGADATAADQPAGAAAPADTGAAPADTGDATDRGAAAPADTPADQPAAPADTPAAPADTPAAPADTPAAPADTPAAPADTPAAPADTPAAPVDTPPADTPAAPADTPAVPADTPAAPVDVPAAPPAAPAPIIVPDPAPVIAPPPPPPPPPPPVITPPEPPTITPVNPVDSGSSSLSSDPDPGLDGIDGLGSDTGDSGIDSGLGSEGFDAGDGGGDGGGD